MKYSALKQTVLAEKLRKSRWKGDVKSWDETNRILNRKWHAKNYEKVKEN